MNLNWKEKGAEVSNQLSITLISKGTQIVGDITADGDIRIDGTVKGKVITKAKLVIGPQGIIEGKVESNQADVSGLIKGDIDVKDTLHLKATAKLNGDMAIGKLIVDPGAEFTGNCTMKGIVIGIQEHKSHDKEGQSKSA